MVLSEVLPPKKIPKRIQTQFSSASTTPFWTPYGVYMGYIWIYIYIYNLLPFEDTQTNKQEAKPSCSRSSIVFGYSEGGSSWTDRRSFLKQICPLLLQAPRIWWCKFCCRDIKTFFCVQMIVGKLLVHRNNSFSKGTR